MTGDRDLCETMLLAEGRICDLPAVGVYHGIGGAQHVCEQHAEDLRRNWGIRVRRDDRAGADLLSAAADR